MWNTGKGGLSNGPIINPSLTSSAKRVSTVWGSMKADWRLWQVWKCQELLVHLDGNRVWSRWWESEQTVYIVGKSAAQVVEVVADHPASVVKDWLFLFVSSLWHRNINWKTYVHGMMGGGGAAGDKRLKTLRKRDISEAMELRLCMLWQSGRGLRITHRRGTYGLQRCGSRVCSRAGAVLL